MLTNKDYNRLTLQHDRHGGIICGVGVKANSEEIAERLYALEEMIENGILMFLPCKVGDTFWLVGKPNLDVPGEIGDTGIYEREVAEIWIWEHSVNLIDQYGGDFCIEMVYFSKEAAEKALEELEK